MQRLIQRLLRKLTTLGQYEESLATISAAAALDRPVALKSKQQLVRRDNCVLNICDDPFVVAQQLTHIEMVSDDRPICVWEDGSIIFYIIDFWNLKKYVCTTVVRKA